MFTKEKLLKFGIPFVFAVAIVIVFIILFLPKGEADLILSAKNISVDINKEFELSYRVSDSYANVTYSLEDNSLVEEVGRFKFKALKPGSTTVTLTAKSISNQTATCKCEIEILPNNLSDDNQSGEIVTPPVDEKPNKPEEAKFFLVSQQNTEILGNTISLKNNKGYFTIELASGMSGNVQLFTTEGITIKAMPMLGTNSYMVSSEVSGKIGVYLNSFFLDEILLIV